MRKTINKLLATILSVIMILSVVSFANNNFTANAATNGHSQADAVAWVNSQVGKALDYDGAYGAQCVDLTVYYYVYLGQSAPYGNANQYVNGGKFLPSGWTYQNSPQAGDIVVWTSGEYGHVAIVTEIRSSSYVIVEQNYNGKQYCTPREIYYFNNNATTYIHPDFISDTTPPSYDDFHVGEFQTTQFTVMAHVTDPSGVKSVRYAVWTLLNGQDDLKWYDGYCTDGNDYYWAHIKYYEHNNEKNTYIIHMYITDNVGNEKSVGIDFCPQGAEMTSGYERVLDDGVYIIANAASPDFERNIYYLDIEDIGYPAKDGTNVSLCGPNNVKRLPYYDLWEITYGKDGFYTIKQFGTNVSLDVEGASNLHAANVISCGYHGGYNQLWAISKNKNGGYRVQAKCSGFSLDVNNGGTANGTNIGQATNNDSDAQSWVFIKHTHFYGAWQTEKAATCTSAGTKSRVCQYCGYIEEEVISATGHNYRSVVTAPTCTEQGYTTNTCSICGAKYTDNYTDSLGHHAGNWIVDSEAQVGVAGSKHKECTVCHIVLETEMIPALEKPVTPPDENAPQIVVESKKARAGKTVDVNISLKNNPGITSAKIKVNFPVGLTLEDVNFGDIGGMTMMSELDESPVTLNWFIGNKDLKASDIVFATLTFKVAEDALIGTKNITVEFDPDDIFDISNKLIDFVAVDGGIEVIKYEPGDITDDGKVNNQDLVILFQYLSGWNVEVNEAALDVNGDGKENNQDLVLLFQFLSGWDVEIF